MMDSSYSLSHLVFYLYHGWIDAMLEMKLRMCDTVEQGHSLKTKLETKTKRV